MNKSPDHFKMYFDKRTDIIATCFIVSKTRKHLTRIPDQQIQCKYITKQVNSVIVQAVEDCIN